MATTKKASPSAAGPAAAAPAGPRRITRGHPPVQDPLGAPTRSDVGNGQRLVKFHSSHLRFVPGSGWLAWDGRRWVNDSEASVFELARRTVRLMGSEAFLMPDSRDSQAWTTWALASLSHARIMAMVAQASSMPGIVAASSTFDDPEVSRYLLNTPSGIVDLVSGQLYEHEPTMHITKLAGVPYDPDAACPRWLEFLDKALDGDAELVGFLQRFFGYAATGDTSEDAVLILFGATGSNGKTTLLETIAQCLGDYAGATAPETFLRRKTGGGNTPELAKLKGLRLVTSYEAAQGSMFDEARLKAITGGDVIEAAAKYKAPITFRPEFKVIFRTNHLPSVDPHDEGVWRRMLVVPFLHRFIGDGCNKAMRERLPREEGPGILRWIVEGAVEWCRGGLRPPASVRLATTAYRAEQQDSVALWLERCIVDSPNAGPAFGLYKRYREWCSDPRQGLSIEDARVFARALEGRGFAKTKTPGRDGYGYFGIELVKGEEQAPEPV